MNQKAKQILQKADVDRLPSLPHVLLQLLDICHDESLSFTDLANILRQDPALYARVCSVCHHHDCEAGHQLNTDTTTSIESSLQHLGINTIKSIAVTATVQQFFSRTSLERTDFLKEHWRHSLYCAYVARAIAEICNYSD
ncbi:MAG: HDOD domain-containing protein, partial [Gammaproteobacteria bacterium]|nr:HDOD domain-containing protein [Gammaproteobacteria bacterium]